MSKQRKFHKKKNVSEIFFLMLLFFSSSEMKICEIIHRIFFLHLNQNRTTKMRIQGFHQIIRTEQDINKIDT